MLQKAFLMMLMIALMMNLSACAGKAQSAPEATPKGTHVLAETVQWPKDKLTLDQDGVPQLKVYVVDDQTVNTMNIETYVEGVLAGEMKNDWPLEALKAQAILARTFVLKFIEEKESKYEGADVSTDITEAQAYSASDINDRIRQAVAETRGIVLSSNEKLPYAWFHAHSGGVTELAQTGLSWNKTEPVYTQVVKSTEPESVSNAADHQALKDAQNWTAVFSFEEFEAACRRLGKEVTLKDGSQISILRRGESGRAQLIDVDGVTLDASELRIALGSTKMRSTLLTSLTTQANGSIYMAGKGYGHGVGMSQWGAYGMAEEGQSAEEIVSHYFRNVVLQKLW